MAGSALHSTTRLGHVRSGLIVLESALLVATLGEIWSGGGCLRYTGWYSTPVWSFVLAGAAVFSALVPGRRPRLAALALALLGFLVTTPSLLAGTRWSGVTHAMACFGALAATLGRAPRRPRLHALVDRATLLLRWALLPAPFLVHCALLSGLRSAGPRGTPGDPLTLTGMLTPMIAALLLAAGLSAITGRITGAVLLALSSTLWWRLHLDEGVVHHGLVPALLVMTGSLGITCLLVSSPGRDVRDVEDGVVVE